MAVKILPIPPTIAMMISPIVWRHDRICWRDLLAMSFKTRLIEWGGGEKSGGGKGH
jgi:hypothetical protein